MKKLINGIEYDLTSTEIAEVNARNTEWNNGALDRALSNLRQTRNSLLAKTDYLALSDNTMSSELSTYRQQLRDCTTGLDTVEKIEAYEFPEEVTS